MNAARMNAACMSAATALPTAVRPEQAGDAAEVRAVLVDAFGAYYGRFGFDAAAAASFVSPYSGPHFMALRLAQTASSEGTVRYPSAFVELG